MKLKKMIAAYALALCAIPFAASAELSKAEWQAKVGECAGNPSAMKATIAQIPASDQAEFVANVNKAIAEKPGSKEAKAADFYAANKAAVSGAADKSSVLAEVFATVPVEYLTDINERFATELFNRNANPEKSVSDAAFVELSTNALAVVNQRCESAEDNAAARQAFAALMFVRASGGSPEGLTDLFVSQMTDSQAKESAGSWISEALGADGKEASYDSMLAAADAGDEPDHAVVLQMTGPSEVMEALIADLQAPGNESASGSSSGMGGGNFTAGSVAGSAVPSEDLSDGRMSRVPRGALGSSTAVGGNSEGTNADEENPYYSRRRGSTSQPVEVEPSDYVK
jgi:hypothetical protein